MAGGRDRRPVRSRNRLGASLPGHRSLSAGTQNASFQILLNNYTVAVTKTGGSLAGILAGGLLLGVVLGAVNVALLLASPIRRAELAVIGGHVRATDIGANR
jgi:hypothetical protein